MMIKEVLPSPEQSSEVLPQPVLDVVGLQVGLQLLFGSNLPPDFEIEQQNKRGIPITSCGEDIDYEEEPLVGQFSAVCEVYDDG